MVGKTDPATGVSWTYAYDDANRMTSATETNAAGDQLYKVDEVYDVFGNRIGQAVLVAGNLAPTVVRSAFAGNQVWADFDGEGHLTTRYLFGAGENEVLARADVAQGVGWYVTDALGSVRDIVTSDGAVVDHIDYDAYGNVTNETNPATGDRFKFAGMQYDATANFYYDHARYYDVESAIWTTQDPDGFNATDVDLYRYVANDPTAGTDSTGMWSLGRWIYTGDGNASDDVYAAASQAAGESFLGNSEKAKTALSVVAMVDPTPISDTLGAGITYAQGKDAEAKQELALAILPGAAGAASKGIKAVKKMASKADDVAKAANKSGDVATAVVAEEKLAAKADNAAGAASAEQRIANGNDELAKRMIKCFAAGTPIRTPDGAKAIEELRVGDLVLSSPEDSPEIPPTYKVVEETYNSSKPVMNVKIASRVIQTTAEHPFWVKGRGWVRADLLRTGDQLRTDDDRWVEVESLSGSVAIVPVYNVRVADYHTYFVGDGTWGFSVWAHNADPCNEAAEGAVTAGKVAPDSSTMPQTRYHYTDEAGMNGIVQSKELRASTKANNPSDVRYGNGQYVSDIVPGTKTPAQLSREFIGQPFQGKRFTNYVEIDVTGLNVVPGRKGVDVIPGDSALDLTRRILDYGPVPPKPR